MNNGNAKNSQAQRVPPQINTSYDQYDDYDYKRYSRPTSTASNIIALYASTDSGDSLEEGTTATTTTNTNQSPFLKEYVDRTQNNVHIHRPLPQPPPIAAPHSASIPRSRTPLPPTPSTAPVSSSQTTHQTRMEVTPPGTAQLGINERPTGYFSNSYNSSNFEPTTPPPWSPESSLNQSTPSEPSSSASQYRQEPSMRQYARYLQYPDQGSTSRYSPTSRRNQGAVVRDQSLRTISGPSSSEQRIATAASSSSFSSPPLFHTSIDEKPPSHLYNQYGQSPLQQQYQHRPTAPRIPTSEPIIIPSRDFSSSSSSSRAAVSSSSSRRAVSFSPRSAISSPPRGVIASSPCGALSSSPRGATNKQALMPSKIQFQEDAYDAGAFYDPALFSSVQLSSVEQDRQANSTPLEMKEDPDYCLLSTVALLLRDSVPRGLHVKGSVNYPFCFTGRDVVSTIQSIIPRETLAWATGYIGNGEVDELELRRIALLIAKTLKSQLFFHEVDWSTGDLQDSVDEVYMFLEDSLRGSERQNNGHGQSNSLNRELSIIEEHGSKTTSGESEELPTGVFTPISSCYSPLCGKGALQKESSCYSSSCPFARSPLKSLTSTTLNELSKLGAPSGINHNAIAWADTVPKEFLANIPKAEVKRQNAILELIQKEEEFLHDLQLLEKLFLARIDKPDLKTGDPPPIPIGPERENFVQEVFSNHRELAHLISQLVEKLHVRQREEYPVVQSVGDIFLDAALNWEGAFRTNMTNFPIAKNRINREASINPRFKVFLEACRRDPACHRLPMDNFLQRATTRLPRYNLHFKSILQDTEESNSDRESLTRAIEIIDTQCKSIQKGVAAAEVKVKIREYAYNLESKRNQSAVRMDLLNPKRELFHQASVYRKPEFAGMEWQELLAVLFDNYLVVTKAKRREEGDNTLSRYVLAKRPIAVEMIQLVGFNDASVSRSVGLSNFHIRSNSERDFRDLYPFTIAHIGGRVEPLTLYVTSKGARDEWKIKLEEAKGLRSAVQETNKVFEPQIISANAFALPTISSLDPEKPPPGADPVLFHGTVTCAVPFQTMDGKRLIAIGCSDGVWIGLRNDPHSLRKVLHLKLVTQCAVLQTFGIFVVLADKVLISYSLDALVPTASSTGNTKPPQKLSGNRDVLFFSVGQLQNRTLLIYMKKKANESVFRALEPVISNIHSHHAKSASGGGGLFGKFGKDSKGSDSFRIYKTFFIPSEAYSMQFLRSKLCIVCARGFEIMNLDSLLPGTIPDFSQVPRDDPKIQYLMKRVETAKPLGMFKNNDSEFLLCYDAFACYVNRLGEPIRLESVIEWEGLPRSVAFRSPFILAFDPRFIEVRDSFTGQLVQLIETNELRNISESSATLALLDDEDEDAILLVQRVRSDLNKRMEGQRGPAYDYQEVFQLVSTANYRQKRPLESNFSPSENNSYTHDSFQANTLNRMGTSSTTRTYASSSTLGRGRAWI